MYTSNVKCWELLKNEVMFKFLGRDLRTLLVLAADLLTIIGVIYLDWNPLRMIGFYYLEVCICVLAFVVYMVLSKQSGILNGASAALILLPFMLVAFKALTFFSKEAGFGKMYDVSSLFYPYFDVGIFLSLIIWSQIFNVKKYLTYEADLSKAGFGIYLAIELLMVPLLILFSYGLHFIIKNLAICLTISLIAVRHFMEHRRYKSFVSIETNFKD